MIYENEFIKIDFATEYGGFPGKILMKILEEEYPVMPEKKGHILEIALGNGKTIHPVIPEGYEPDRYRLENCERIQFDRMPFADQNGEKFETFFLTIRYEFWDDGTVFATTYFVCEQYMTDFSICSCKFNFRLDFNAFEEIGIPVGALADFSKGAGSPEKFCDFTREGIIPNFNFSCKRKDSAGIYAEIFMEEAPSLERRKENCSTQVVWKEKTVDICWDFQSKEAFANKGFEWAFLNSWGFLFRAAPQKRRNPPLRMYHVIDNYTGRIPSLHTLHLMHEAGADVVVLHEAWRSDPVNFAVPWDPAALKSFIGEAHKLDMRVVLYIRGHQELTTMEESCDWFGMYLRENWDGLYADFGGACNGMTDGRIRFRMHYLKIRNIRKVLGKHGLFYAHSGMLSSGIGLTPELVDGYVSGEGENGVLGSGRFVHEHVSGSFLTNGTFWTAAFPHYGDGRMIPFMASTGQYPHMPLGTQWKSSSLSHPGVPGVNDIYIRALWKLWGTFKYMRDIVYYTDYNSCGVIANPGKEELGVYLQTAPAGKCALLILANFSKEEKNCSISIDWSKVVSGNWDGPFKVWKLTPDEKSPGKAVEYKSFTDFSLCLAGNSVGGFFIGNEEASSSVIKEFERSYPEISEEQKKHFQLVQKQKELRKAPGSAVEDLYMKMVMPEAHIPFICVKEFHSLEHRIGFMDENGKFVFLGYITKKGFTREKPSPEDWVWSQEESEWISLREIFPKGGRYTVVIRSFGILIMGKGEYFHSLHELILSPEKHKEGKNTHLLTFLNEVEPQRENFHFDIFLTEKE